MPTVGRDGEVETGGASRSPATSVRVSSLGSSPETPNTNLSGRSTTTDRLGTGATQPAAEGAGRVLQVDEALWAEVVADLTPRPRPRRVERRERRPDPLPGLDVPAQHLAGIHSDADHGPADPEGVVEPNGSAVIGPDRRLRREHAFDATKAAWPIQVLALAVPGLGLHPHVADPAADAGVRTAAHIAASRALALAGFFSDARLLLKIEKSIIALVCGARSDW